MAAECEETCLDLSVSDYDSNVITHMQAVCRGWLVRKKLREAQKEFHEIVQELDGPAVRVDWTESALPRPSVCKISKKMRAGKHPNQMHTCEQQCESKPNKIEEPKPESDLGCPKCAEKMSAHKEKESVEEKSRVPVIFEPISDKTQSDQVVQTEFFLTSQQSEETHAENTKKHDPIAEDCLQPVKDIVCQTENHFQTNQLSDEKDSVTAEFSANQVVESNRKQYCEAADGVADRDGTNIPFPSVSGTAASSRGVQPSAHVSSEGLTESSIIRRVDSFFGDQTSVWDSSSSGLQDHEAVSRQPHGRHDGHRGGSAEQQTSPETGTNMREAKLRSLSSQELLKQRQNVAMELLWVQQAIISRKKYLKLKMQMEAAS